MILIVNRCSMRGITRRGRICPSPEHEELHSRRATSHRCDSSFTLKIGLAHNVGLVTSVTKHVSRALDGKLSIELYVKSR